ncbi:MAG: DUF805 domain-containing protein [Desulfovibrionaceae bacterium]|nr:DUF805 domain-containing protein [Desulfovibrionaceae bacterium]
MNFKNAVAACLAQYTSLQGRATRAELWYFVVFILAASFIVYVLSQLFLPPHYAPVLQGMVLLALAIPLFSVFVRRLHDIGAPTWRVVFLFIPFVQIICLYWAVKPSQEGENRFGEQPVD